MDKLNKMQTKYIMWWLCWNWLHQCEKVNLKNTLKEHRYLEYTIPEEMHLLDVQIQKLGLVDHIYLVKFHILKR